MLNGVGILAEAKFTSMDMGITAGTVYEVMQLIEHDDYFEFKFYDDNIKMTTGFYYTNPRDAVYNNDLFQLYYQF